MKVVKECKSCQGEGCESCYWTGEWNVAGRYLKESDYEEEDE